MFESLTLEALGSFRFLRPWWLVGLLPLALLIFFWIRRTREQSAWSAAISQPLLEVLLDAASSGEIARRSRWWITL